MASVRFKKASWDEFYAVSRDSETELYLDGVSFNLIGKSDGLEVATLEADLPTLYKKAADGEWQEMKFLVVVGTPQGAHLVNTISHPNKKTMEYTTVIKTVPSKSYSTVIQERTLAKWIKKKARDGWVDNKEEKVIGEPMLLHHWDEYKDRIRYPALISPKYNGIRCTFKFESNNPEDSVHLSRKRNPLYFKELKKQCNILGVSLDGELWAEGKELEDIVSMVSRDDRDLKYMVFDMIPPLSSDMGYMSRLTYIMDKVKAGYFPNIQIVPQAVVQNEEEAEVYFGLIKDMPGVDGAVIRNTGYGMELNIRSYDILKMKEVISEEYRCTGMEYDEDPIGKLGKFVFTCDKIGDTFMYVPNRTKEERLLMYKEFLTEPARYLGHTYTLTFREYTKRGLPRHILSINERNYE